MPSSVKRKWRRGSSKGELMTGFWTTTWVIYQIVGTVVRA